MKREHRLHFGLFCAAAIALWFPLHAVVQRSRSRALANLVATDEGAIADDEDHYYDHSPLVYKAVKALLNKGADPNTKDDSGQLPISKAVRVRDTDMIDLLERFGAQKDAETEWFASAVIGRDTIMEKMLAGGTKPDLRNIDGNTALHFAAFHGRVAVIKLLLKHGASINLLNKDKATPFDISRGTDNPEAVRVLKAAGAKYSPLNPIKTFSSN